MATETKPRLHDAPGNPTDPISDLHRKWGTPAAATDLDLILLELAPVGALAALIDYKLGVDRKIGETEATLVKRIGELGERATLPAFCVRYGNSNGRQPWRFKVYPLNSYAKGSMPFARGEAISERDYVRFLYQLRGLKLPVDVAQDLDDRC